MNNEHNKIKIETSKVKLIWKVDDTELCIQMDGKFDLNCGEFDIHCAEAEKYCIQEEIRVFGERKTPNLLKRIQEANNECHDYPMAGAK